MKPDNLEQLTQLIEDCIKGNRQAQSQLYDLFKQKMFVICLRYSDNREESEEVLQEGFLRIFEYLNQFKFEGSFEGWMRKIMVNCALKKFRSKRKMHAVGQIELTEIAGFDHEEILANITSKELLVYVQQLPPAYRIVFNLFVFEGMKHREIAAMLNISEGTSKSNLSDARLLLQRAISKAFKSNNLTTARHG